MHYGRKVTVRDLKYNRIQIKESVSTDSHSPRPGIDTGHLETEMPAAGVGALTFGPGAHAVTVGFPVLPAAAISPTVVKIESAPVNLRTIGGSTSRARLRRTYTTCLWQLGAPRHPVRCPRRLLARVRLLLHLSRNYRRHCLVRFHAFLVPPSRRLLLLLLLDTFVSFVFVLVVIVIVVAIVLVLAHQHLVHGLCPVRRSIPRHLLFRRRRNLLRRPRRRLLTSASTGSLQ